MLWGSWQTVKDPVIPGTCLWCWRASELSPPGSWTQTHSTINCWLPAARTPTSFWLCYKAPTRLLYCAVLNMSQQTHLANTKDSFCQLLCFPGAQQAKRPTDPQRGGFKPADRWGQQLSAALCHPPCPQRSPLDGSAYFIWVFWTPDALCGLKLGSHYTKDARREVICSSQMIPCPHRAGFPVIFCLEYENNQPLML